LFRHTLAALLILGSCAHATTIHVPGDQPTIQAGLEAAGAGDTVLVAPGTYTGPGNKNLDFGGVDRVLRSESGATVTLIDCESDGRGFYFRGGETSATVVEGFTIANGRVDGEWPAGSGGGLLCCSFSSPTLKNCTIRDNVANDTGGGLFCHDNSAPNLDHCAIEHNRTSTWGGGIAASLSSSPTLLHCSINWNWASGEGGGIYWEDGSSPIVEGCTLEGNYAYFGGGFACRSGWIAMTNCTATGNSAYFGGGGYCDFTSGVLAGCALVNNSATANGGALWLMSASSEISNCIISGNHADYGAGIAADNSLFTLESCTIVDNLAADGGGALHLEFSSPALTSCILWGNLPDEIQSNPMEMPWLAYCDITGGYEGDGNINEDPLFVDAPLGDYQLLPGSPCVDTATPGVHDACIPPGMGTPAADMGAYGGGRNCLMLPPCRDLALAGVRVPASIYADDSGVGRLSLWNCSSAPIEIAATWDCPWLIVTPATDTIPAWTMVDLELILDATGLVPGTSECPLSIAYADTGEIETMVQLHVLSPLAVTVTEHPETVRAGQQLRWDFDLVNLSNRSRVAKVWFDAYIIDGSPLPENPFSGPISGTIAAGDTASFFNIARVPVSAPIGSPYRICTLVGPYPPAWDSCCFEFALQP
jgi:hypothetical protein